MMPSAGDPAHAAAGRRAGGSNAFKFFEPLRLQLRGAPDAVQAAVARDKAAAGRDGTAPYVEARIRAVMLATSLLLNEARTKVPIHPTTPATSTTFRPGFLCMHAEVRP